jgi:hypothetical protein
MGCLAGPMSQQEKERLGEGKERGNTSHRDLSDERVRVRADKRNRLVEAERASRQHEQKRERWIRHAKFLRTHRRQQCGPKTRTGWLKTGRSRPQLNEKKRVISGMNLFTGHE